LQNFNGVTILAIARYTPHLIIVLFFGGDDNDDNK
jgi:hypothetical protein